MRIVAVALLLLCVVAVSAIPAYQKELPNIPNVEGSPWPGVGHIARQGGGARNAFGKAFAAAGHKWTPELCKADSDGDGFTNGQELGDLDCTWSVGKPRPTPAAGRKLSHPGLADQVPI